MCPWLMIPVASCHGSVLISAGMKVTEDDRQPNAFSPAADFQTQTPGLRQMGVGRSNYATADLQLVLCDGAVTRFTLGPFCLFTASPSGKIFGLILS